MTTKQKAQSKELVLAEPRENALSTWVSGDTFETLSGLANKFSQSQLVPQHFRGKPHDCFIAMQLANRMQIDPFLALQNLNVLHGRPSWAATFIIALMNERGPFAEKVKFREEGEGASLKVTAFAKLKDSEEIAHAAASMEMAKAEGWTKNVKYQTMPAQMLCYRAATFLCRRYCPELLTGMQTQEEVEDVAVSAARPVNGAVIEAAPAAEPESAAARKKAINEQIQNQI